jgi:DNA-binding GntR family transcriptional regulator
VQILPAATTQPRAAIRYNAQSPIDRLYDCPTISIMTDNMHISPSSASLRRAIEMRLRTAIVEGRFKPGDRLIEREMCQLLGVSRASLREALRQLEAEELVTIVPHRGPVVSELTAKAGFYEVLLERCGNRIAGRILTQLNNRVGLLRSTSMSQKGRLKNTLAEITCIVDAIERRDADGAWQATVDHIARAAEVAIHVLRQQHERDPERNGDARARTG